MLFECLYTKSNNRFIVAKLTPAAWSAAEQGAAFIIREEDLTAEQVKSKTSSALGAIQKDIIEMQLKAKQDAEAKAEAKAKEKENGSV